MSRSKRALKGVASLLSAPVLIVCVMQAGCSGYFNPQSKVGVNGVSGESVANENVQLKARVVLSKPNSMHDDFMDGTSKSYDMTVFETLEPAAYKGVRLRVVNEHVPGLVPMRVEVGKTYMIEVGSRSLRNSEAFIPPESVRVISEI